MSDNTFTRADALATVSELLMPKKDQEEESILEGDELIDHLNSSISSTETKITTRYELAGGGPSIWMIVTHSRKFFVEKMEVEYCNWGIEPIIQRIRDESIIKVYEDTFDWRKEEVRDFFKKIGEEVKW